MTQSRFFALCLLTVAGAFAGGYAANLSVPVVHAQLVPPAAMRATSFVLVDPQGKTAATLRSGASGAELTLKDPAGNSRVEITASGGIVVRDRTGRTLWSSPRGQGIVPASE